MRKEKMYKRVTVLTAGIMLTGAFGGFGTTAVQAEESSVSELENYSSDEKVTLTLFYIMDSEPWVERAKETEDLIVPASGKREHIYMFRHDLKIEGEGIVYNKKIFKEAGIEELPNNYDEFLEACEKIKVIGVTPFFIPGKDSWTVQIWQTIAMGDVAENIDPELMNDINSGKRSWSDSEEFKEVNRQLLNIVEKGYANENVLADDYNKAQEEFLNGNFAMLAAVDSFMATILEQDPNMEVGIFPVPWRENASLGTGTVRACAGTETVCTKIC